ncbi:MAG: thiamine diphosphokinase [Enterococcus sp.]
MNILIVGGGSPDLWPVIDFNTFDFFIGIDRGALYLLEQKQILHLAIGDFDSITLEERAHVFSKAENIEQSKPEKDDTDTQLALDWAFLNYPDANVLLIGVTGGRIDHLLANIWLGTEPRYRPFLSQVTLADKQNTLHYYLPGNYTIFHEENMTYLAYCCLTPVENLTLEKSKYTLENKNVLFPTSFASNEFIGPTANFSFTKGILAVVQSKD